MQTVNNVVNNDRSWQKLIMKYTQPDNRKSIVQVINTFIPYLIMWFLMVLTIKISYVLTFILAIIAAGFLVRIFIIFHDCGHGSFFKSKKTNDIVGIISGFIVHTPYYKWHAQHADHHATTVNLDQRGLGDIWTMTVSEYLSATKWQRFMYRTVRNPFILFIFGPIYLIFMLNRVTKKGMNSRAKWNVYLTNIVILAFAVGMSFLIGIKAFLFIHLTHLFIAQAVGLWLFYAQHNFEDVNWERSETWDYKSAAIHGSSFLKLPIVLQWFTGNIGFHHVHHLSPRIPNYNLARCQAENDLFKDVKPITLMSTFKAMKLSLWDEASHQLIRFRNVRTSQ
ncbi:MAG TPA: fatty acid desaturase [Prolixibacteraceae bacterium]|nr:fatty acid desaturase [Prolixibacteraceae bacterium]